jgi:hypothetical protein
MTDSKRMERERREIDKRKRSRIGAWRRHRGSYFSGLNRSVWTLGLATATLCPESMLQ